MTMLALTVLIYQWHGVWQGCILLHRWYCWWYWRGASEVTVLIAETRFQQTALVVLPTPPNFKALVIELQEWKIWNLVVFTGTEEEFWAFSFSNGINCLYLNLYSHLVILKGDRLAPLCPLEGPMGAIVHLVEPVVRAREPEKKTCYAWASESIWHLEKMLFVCNTSVWQKEGVGKVIKQAHSPIAPPPPILTNLLLQPFPSQTLSSPSSSDLFQRKKETFWKICFTAHYLLNSL